jgi:hypothetical protein
MIPKIGSQIIEFGNAADVEEKFNKLQLFYKNVMVKTGWSKYSIINVQYKNQVVAKRRGAEDKTADSVRTLQIMQLIAASAAKQAEDSVQTILQDNNNNTADGSMIQQSIQREDNFETANPTNALPLELINNQPVIKTENINPLPLAKPASTKPAVSNPNPSKKPEAVKPAVKSNPSKKTITNSVIKQKPVQQKPKAVMQNKNDY